ncbi:SUR7/PalI family-domain-containing protein [Pseudomassariella vexata]|uniref:SUR7/PalI family-domain-containing protein n=1 Tax=Pseudomassariella vexata TaxID=1141098 RepID=A0A1Y2DN96_9PEZI|nr:SUR7/PalI family-domain-containing protein [Pseudomassariella vexata]ORY60125.1 SUR7/PalI family-domain-containing protein [Pseudomassariella vexata]
MTLAASCSSAPPSFSSSPASAPPSCTTFSVLKVNLQKNNNEFSPDISFGTFGWCVIQSGDDDCSHSHVGYDAAGVLSNNSNCIFDTSDFAGDTANALTRVMVLHPVAAGLSFLSFLLALGTGVVGSFLAALVSLLTFIVTLVVLITDFVGFAILKNAVNRSDTGASSEFVLAVYFFCPFLLIYLEEKQFCYYLPSYSVDSSRCRHLQPSRHRHRFLHLLQRPPAQEEIDRHRQG